jgi:hypothetical protein
MERYRILRDCYFYQLPRYQEFFISDLETDPKAMASLRGSKLYRGQMREP